MSNTVCPYFGKCGGCSLLNIPYEKQLEDKQKLFVEKLSSLAPDVVFDSPVSGPSEHYRSRARFRYSKEGLSFYEEHSNSPVVIKECPILDEQLNCLLANPPKINLWELEDAQLPCISTDKKVIIDSSMGWITVKDRKLPVSNDVFFQSNLFLLPKLIDYVSENVSGKYVMDLYSGVGTFSAFLEDSYRVTAVEINRKCLSLAKMHLKNTQFFASPVEKWNSGKRSTDTVIVDPPRTGLDRNVPAMIASWNPQTIIYVSCYLNTQLRDIERFIQLGYKPAKARLFDFYPHTPHVETVVLMSHI